MEGAATSSDGDGGDSPAHPRTTTVDAPPAGAPSIDAPPADVLLAGAACACGVREGSDESGRKAVGVDPDIRDRNLKRLRRIEGQVRGLQRMIEDDRYCADVLTQISSVHEALRAVGRELMRNHLKHCASAAIRSGEEEAEAMYDELVELMYRYVR